MINWIKIHINILKMSMKTVFSMLRLQYCKLLFTVYLDLLLSVLYNGL